MTRPHDNFLYSLDTSLHPAWGECPVVKVYRFRPEPESAAEHPIGYIPWSVIRRACDSWAFGTLMYKAAAELGLTTSPFDIEIVSLEKPCLLRWPGRSRKWGCVTFKVVRVWVAEDVVDRAQELARRIANIIIDLVAGG